MPINRKALYASLLAALPAPLILVLIITASGADLDLGSLHEAVAYLIAYALFAVVALIASGLAAPERRPGTGRRGGKILGGGRNTEEGTVKWFNVKKGFGFITRDSGGDVFVHFRAIEGEGRRALRQGQRVRYQVVEAEKGLQANEVETIDGD